MILDFIEKPADVKALSIELTVATAYVCKLLSSYKALLKNLGARSTVVMSVA